MNKQAKNKLIEIIDRKIDQKIDRSIASKFDAPPTINQLVVDPHTRDDHKNLRDTDNLPERPYYAVASPNNTPCGKFGMLKNTQVLFQETHAEDVETQHVLGFSLRDPFKTCHATELTPMLPYLQMVNPNNTP